MERSSKRRRISKELGRFQELGMDAPIRARKAILEGVLADGFLYSKKLTGHTSCVNSLAFSHGQNKWLASAGDDPYICLWDLHQDDVMSPSYGLVGPRANVFALAFSADDQWLYSGDTDNTIYQYDATYLDGSPGAPNAIKPTAVFGHHEDSVRAISCSPVGNTEFLSAADDGCIILHDIREPSHRRRARNVLMHPAEVACVQFHPHLPHIFVTSDARGEMCLRDMRMAFGPKAQRRNQGIVQEYVTTLSKGTKFGRPEASSVAFDDTGTRLGATMLFHHPTIYALHDPYPIAVCSGKSLPGGAAAPVGERGYVNACTIKHGSFSGPGFGDACYYAAGSDDFCAYVWEVPDVATLVAQRELVSVDDWFDERYQGVTGFSRGRMQERVVPVELSSPFARVTGHRSIVNTALFHPNQLLLATAGIERHVLLHSPTSTPPCFPESELERTDLAVRRLPLADPDYNRLFRQALGIGLPMDEPDDDRGAIALFDEIIRQEGDVDLFALRPWSPETDEADSDGVSASEDQADSPDGDRDGDADL